MKPAPRRVVVEDGPRGHAQVAARAVSSTPPGSTSWAAVERRGGAVQPSARCSARARLGEGDGDAVGPRAWGTSSRSTSASEYVRCSPRAPGPCSVVSESPQPDNRPTARGHPAPRRKRTTTRKSAYAATLYPPRGRTGQNGAPCSAFHPRALRLLMPLLEKEPLEPGRFHLRATQSR